ncbi:MAG TPA: HDIG domain-containing protein [Anaerolineales bacterium]|nr:HDIG domain-containing protein [Anaerolineales bacterium]
MERIPPAPLSLRTLRAFLVIAVTTVTYAALVLPLSLRPAAPPLRAGDVAPYDIQAPRDAEYVSQVRTGEVRDAAEKAVLPVYTAPDPATARQQLDRLRDAFSRISLARVDETVTIEQRETTISAIVPPGLSVERARQVLGMSEPRWLAVQQEALRVLEQVMRTAVRSENLDDLPNEISGRVSLAMNEQDAALVSEIVNAFVVPNSQFSQELTDAAQASARDRVSPVVRSYKRGELIVGGGEIISDADMEALQELGLANTQRPVETFLSAGAVTLTVALLIVMYLYRHPRFQYLTDSRSLLVLAFIFIGFLITARLVVPNRTIVPYAFPLPAAGLLLATLFGMETGMIFSLGMCVLATYGQANAQILLPYYLFSSWCGVVMLGQARRIWAFFRAGMTVAAVAVAMIVGYRIASGDMDWIGLATLVGAATFNGLASAGLALLLQFLLAQFLSLPTALQLLEISRPDFPLLQEFLRKAPGTYQHSLHVANLAEQAAEKISADALLTRVGAIYHDIGKTMVEPSFFIENQIPGSVNTHTDITPEQAAASILKHVRDGVVLARKHRLPRRIEDFILEHHGTMLTRYQYMQAVERAGGDAEKVNKDIFRYPGPRPRSRETAILMLADACEARSRAENPQSEERLREIVRSVIEIVERDGQLDNTQLTLHDLHLVTESFITTLRGTYHPRIQYPAAEVPSSAPVETRPEKGG